MIPFHSIYSWLFKSFRISGETELIDRLIAEGQTRVMIIKRSWIFALFVLWIPLSILLLSGLSIWIASVSIAIPSIRSIIVGGNILMATILFVSSWNYIRHFREIQSMAVLSEDPISLIKYLELWDRYFISFFDASVTNQFILIVTIASEIWLMFFYQRVLWEHFWVLTTDILVMIIEIILLKIYRNGMIDLEMDYNVIIPGKIYFVNQSGVLSSVQTIESEKIKTIRSLFPSRLASFFDYGTVDILLEGDTQSLLGTMSMYYVSDPDTVVAKIQSLLDTFRYETPQHIAPEPGTLQANSDEMHTSESIEHTIDTKGKVREVLE